MGMLVALSHTTHYTYDRDVHLGPQVIRLRPAPHSKAIVQSYSMKVEPGEHFINWQQDPFGNYLARLVFPKKTRELKVQVDLVTEMRVFNPLDFFLEEENMRFPFSYEASLKEELTSYLEAKESGVLLMELVASVDKGAMGAIEFLSMCSTMIHERLRYTVRMEQGVQSCEQTLQCGSGSCRDMAWLLCQLLRHLGLATRFVSGYLIQLAQDIPSLDGPSGPEQDFTDLHAWTEVYLPGAGWIGLDPTSGLFAGEGHIPLCCSPAPSNAAPISGPLDACETEFSVLMNVVRVHEDRRTTKPFLDAEWKAIQQLGDQVDKSLDEQDVRLTMGGEPTFVSLDSPQDEQWNFTALGEEKLRLGDELLWRLRAKISPQGLVQYCQGKWYPGEPLPRWAINCFSRKDGEAVWSDDTLLARPGNDLQHDLGTAERFIAGLAKTLGLSGDYILPAHEDAAYYLWKEQRLPIEGDMFKADLTEVNERRRLQKLLDKDLNTPVGYILPLHYSRRRSEWISNRWAFRSGRLTLTIGDSPIGLRLPLANLPKVPKASEDVFPERSPFEKVPVLGKRKSLMAALTKREKQGVSDATYADDPVGLIKTALCVESREGVLHIFLPPVSYVEHFLDLVTAIETVAKEQNVAVILEGYTPPQDTRTTQYSVTPDPGVLEVNMPPAASWKELQELTTALYEEARTARLTTEKYVLDGRIVGTGGGNHIVVGAERPEHSPFLRRPDLLRSMVTFWQHHPALSYLFAAQYIGPTSQAPRIDEARHDALFELEIAFQQIPSEKKVPFWLTDRIFRNLLVDLTGNTHRAEFCIDKLYSPDGQRGRLGLLEMRGFEMTPNVRMNLLQALLVRACIASFWKTPYHKKLIPWGTRLHDKYMLPEYILEDLGDALETLKEAGHEFDIAWFEPFFQFRFPQFGSVQLGPVQLEIRYALEPWPILGEEMFNGGVSRSVDSSVERLQVRVNGLVEGRHVITCNEHVVPLHRGVARGVWVGGIRYKAWAPSNCLHPTIPAHTPLVFDVVDTANNRSIGGCTYHVMHPGGRSYEEFPVNGNEAEGRRLSRFQPMGHSPGDWSVKTTQTHSDFPCTLDLRRIRTP